MTIKPAVLQTYAEFGVDETKDNKTDTGELMDNLKLIRARLSAWIPKGVGIGRADFILGSTRPSYITYRIWIDQFYKTMDDFDANEVIDQILSDLQMTNVGIHLQVGKTYDTLSTGIQVPCPKCTGKYLYDCSNCDSQSVSFSTDDGIVLLNQVGV